MQNRYEQMSINEIESIMRRLQAAAHNPRCANIEQVLAWWGEAIAAYRIANGMEVA